MCCIGICFHPILIFASFFFVLQDWRISMHLQYLFDGYEHFCVTYIYNVLVHSDKDVKLLKSQGHLLCCVVSFCWCFICEIMIDVYLYCFSM